MESSRKTLHELSPRIPQKTIISLLLNIENENSCKKKQRRSPSKKKKRGKN
jgi:hypothetical protein